jgi:hypothetical protein
MGLGRGRVVARPKGIGRASGPRVLRWPVRGAAHHAGIGRAAGAWSWGLF